MQQDTLKTLRQQVGALMSKSGAQRYKQDVLTPYGVERLRDMTEAQLAHLKDRLIAICKNRETTHEETRKLRSMVLSLVQDYGYRAREGDWSEVNQFLLRPQVGGKLLYEMDDDELIKCGKRIRVLIRKRADDARRQEELSKLN